MQHFIGRALAAIALLTALTVSAYAADNPEVVLQTSRGSITIELYPKKAPVTVKNFLAYVDSGFYDGTIFHRVIPNFVIQGGGFTPAMKEKPTRAPIVNESKNWLHNERGTIAMARTSDPNSATSQFFINLRMNTSLDYMPGHPGYTVFGKVIDGMSTVDAIAVQPTTKKDGMQNVPVKPIVIEHAYRKKSSPTSKSGK